MWRQLDLFVPEEPDMVAIGVLFQKLLADYEAKQKILPERPRLLTQSSKRCGCNVSPDAPTKEQIEPLLRAGMSGGSIAQQFGVAPYVVFNAIYRLWPESGGSVKRIRKSFEVAASEPLRRFQSKPKPAEPDPQPLPKVRMPVFLSTERPAYAVPSRVVTAEELARM